MTLKRGRHIKHAPHVFTEHGAIMLASVLKSKVAMEAGLLKVANCDLEERKKHVEVELTRAEKGGLRSA